MDKDMKIQRGIPSQEIKLEDERELLETSEGIQYMAPSTIRNSSEAYSHFQEANAKLKNICTFPFKNNVSNTVSTIAKNAHALPNTATTPKNKKHH